MRAASYCDVTLIYYSDSVSMDAFIITMALSARAIQHGAHRHDRRGIYRCVLRRFRGRIEIDHSYGLHCRGLCCHSRHSTRGPAGRRGRKWPRDGRPTRAVPGVAAQTTPAQTVSWSIPITNKTQTYLQISNTRRTLAGNKNADYWDVVGASPVGAAPTTSSCSTWHLAFGICCIL